LVVIEATS